MIRSINQYVSFCCRSKKVDAVIFGHTHRAGKAKLSDGAVRYVRNSGTFLRESPFSPAGSYLIIRNGGRTPLDQAVEIRHLPL